MPDTSGDTKPQTFATQDWSEPAETTSPVADPVSSETTTAPPPADATTPPVETPSQTEAPPEGGPIPFERHKSILEGERAKYADLDGKWQRVEWAQSLVDAGKTPAQVQEALGLYDGLDSDYVGTLDRLFRFADQSPQLQAAVRSLAGRWLGTGALRETPQDADPEPQPDFQDGATGKPFFSVERQREWNAWRERQLEKRLSEKYDPLVRAHEDTQRQAQQVAHERQEAQAIMAEFKRYENEPHFKENSKAILELIKSSGWQMSIGDAYNRVLTTKVIPSLTSTVKADQLADLQRQANASGLKPSAAAPATPGNYKRFSDIPADKW